MTMLAVVLAGGLAIPGVTKLTREEVRLRFEHFGLPLRLAPLTGVAEVATAGLALVGIIWAPVAVVAGVAGAGLMAGAANAHLRRARDPLRAAVPAIALGLVAVALVVISVGDL